MAVGVAAAIELLGACPSCVMPQFWNLVPRVKGVAYGHGTALPEIVTQGDDLEDALFKARDAIELSLSVRGDEGDESACRRRKNET